ncbi:MAG: phage tail protein [Flavobacteriales bacterium]|nr:phage tail protein [Flavobacteriales bacterium]
MDSDYPVNFRFELNFMGEDAAFSEVTGISKEISVEEVVSGGENRYKYRLPIVSTSQNLILKRAVVPSGSAFIIWVMAVFENGFFLPIVTVPIMVSLLDHKGDISVMWLFHDCYPVKYSVSDLKSDGNEIAIESVELAYSHFNVI